MRSLCLPAGIGLQPRIERLLASPWCLFCNTRAYNSLRIKAQSKPTQKIFSTIQCTIFYLLAGAMAHDVCPPSIQELESREIANTLKGRPDNIVS